MKCDLQQINIKSHEEVDQDQHQGKIEPDIIDHASEIFGKEQIVVRQQKDGGKVQHSQKETLLEILFNRIKIIGKDEHGFPAYHAAQNVRCPGVLPTERDQQKQDTDRNDRVGSRCVEYGHTDLRSEQVQQKIGGRCGVDQICAVQLRKQRICLRRRLPNGKIQINSQQHGKHLHQHDHVQ